MTRPSPNPEQRQHPRMPLPVGYAAVRVRRAGHDEYDSTGHAYDLSEGGVRFELDQPLGMGEEVEVELDLPGDHGGTVRARGIMVRLHDPDEAGPVRMGLSFTGLESRTDRSTLERFLDGAMAPTRPDKVGKPQAVAAVK